MRSLLFDESFLMLKRDVDSAVVAATSLSAFPIGPKINVKTVDNLRSTENLKLEVSQIFPQRDDERHYKFFEFKLGGYGERTLMVLFQHRAPPRKEEGEELADVLKNIK